MKREKKLRASSLETASSVTRYSAELKISTALTP